MKKAPKISILMPVYNAAETLTAAVDSVLKQSFNDFELVIVNDGSTDKSLELVNKLAKSDSRIKVYDQENQGVAGALNTALGAARAPWIARIDADDRYLGDKLDLQHQFIKSNSDVDMVVTGSRLVTSEVSTKDLPFFRERDLKRSFFVRNPIVHGTVMVRRSVIDSLGRYSQQVGPTEDYDLWLKMLVNGSKIAALPKVLYERYDGAQTVSATNQSAQMQYTDHLKKWLWTHQSPGIDGPLKIMSANRSYSKDKELGKYFKSKLITQNIEIAKEYHHCRKDIRAIYQLLAVATSSFEGLKVISSKLLKKFRN